MEGESSVWARDSCEEYYSKHKKRLPKRKFPGASRVPVPGYCELSRVTNEALTRGSSIETACMSVRSRHESS
jgi:hypothetical protein